MKGDARKCNPFIISYQTILTGSYSITCPALTVSLCCQYSFYDSYSGLKRLTIFAILRITGSYSLVTNLKSPIDHSYRFFDLRNLLLR